MIDSCRQSTMRFLVAARNGATALTTSSSSTAVAHCCRSSRQYYYHYYQQRRNNFFVSRNLPSSSILPPTNTERITPIRFRQRQMTLFSTTATAPTNSTTSSRSPSSSSPSLSPPPPPPPPPPPKTTASSSSSSWNQQFWGWRWMSSGWSLGSIEQRHLADGVSAVFQQARRTKEHDRLRNLIQQSVRQYLQDRNIIPAGDSSSSMMSILETRPSRVSVSSSSSSPSKIDDGDGAEAMVISLSKFGQNLFALNGFEEVAVPCSTNDRLRLAEGVVATPTVDPQIAKNRSLRQRRRRYGGGGSSHGSDGEYTSVTWMFSRKHDPHDTLSVSSSSNSNKQHIKTKFPKIVQDDIRLYRILENQATLLLDRWYDRITSWYERKIKLPYQIQVLRLKNVLDDVGDRFIWVYRQVRSGHFPSSSPPKEIPTQRVKSSPEEIVKMVVDDDDDRTDHGIDEGVDRMSTVSIDNNLKNMENSIAVKDESSMIEDLLVIHALSGRNFNHKGNKNNDNGTDNNTVTVPTLTLYTEMTPSTRIVALPHYTLGHSSASTLVSISLVVFGAIPLAYRSLKFMYDYPEYANMIAASVLLSISYGIWSQRSSAWTNQSYVVSNAMWHRLQGRDEAVVLSLEESAIDRVCEAVLDEYYRYQLPVFFPSKDCPWEQRVPELETPFEIAVDLGLIRPKDDGNDANTVVRDENPHQGPTRWKSVNVEDALRYLS